ncbi:MAG TPA: SMC-Scp complex subunit ScpB [Chloroflexota bacterium]|nr:SMC-Scp complex subunit ScpB [Chloroflexota bacterium]
MSVGERPGLTPDALVEALLFVADGPVELQRLQRALGLDRATLDAAIAALAERYAGRGVRLQRTGDSIALVSAPEAAEQIERFLGLSDSSRLSAATMETLAIVAYRQPVTRAQIEAIRGVNADYALRTLLARNLVAEVGRLDTVGRPAVFGTTFEFLRYFGLESLEQLPELPEALAELAAARAAAAREPER